MALDNRANDESLLTGRDIGLHYGGYEPGGRLVDRSGLADELKTRERSLD